MALPRSRNPDEATNSLKFSLPFLHTFTQIAWNVYNYEQTLENINNLDEARMWVRIGAEYTLASYPTKYEFIGMFGIADNVDFNWQGPTEEWVSGLGFSRANGSFATYITKTKKSSEITGQAAAAMALASMTLRKTDPTFANRCLQAARNLFDFGHQYRGSYMAWGTKDRVFGTHAEYYPSGSYYDEMGLGAAFLYLATNETSYLKLARSYWKLEYDRQQKSKGTFPQFWQVYDWLVTFHRIVVRFGFTKCLLCPLPFLETGRTSSPLSDCCWPKSTERSPPSTPPSSAATWIFGNRTAQQSTGTASPTQWSPRRKGKR